MSRIGKHPVVIPEGVDVTIDGQSISATGRLGAMSMLIHKEIVAVKDNNAIIVRPRTTSRQAKQMWATSRTLINNMVTGVMAGYTINLEINGIGYRAAVQENILTLNLGYSHLIRYPIPQDVTITTDRPTTIKIHGRDKQQVGQIAANIRQFRKPEPYKGKGIKYDFETVIRKEGKKK